MAANSGGIRLLHFAGAELSSDAEIRAYIKDLYPKSTIEPDAGTRLLNEAREAILLYLSKGTPLPAFPVDIKNGTTFQREVWEALCTIPHGETRSYLEIACGIGRPAAARAVGQACAKNPIAILIPCHRVLASGGAMGGYSGGLHIKKALLELETMPSSGSQRSQQKR
ncbi:MAG: methylated-DNA--[protein]-cysteine S-methyltransferase [Syntrophobacteraceae bacterium]